jgi:hypothetical protein
MLVEMLRTALNTVRANLDSPRVLSAELAATDFVAEHVEHAMDGKTDDWSRAWLDAARATRRFLRHRSEANREGWTAAYAALPPMDGPQDAA